MEKGRIFYNLILDFCVITRTGFFLRDKRLFEITEVEITRVDCIFVVKCLNNLQNSGDPDQMPLYVASDLGLHFLPITL